MKRSASRWVRSVIVLAALAPFGWLVQAAPPPELTSLPPIDLSPGPDVTEPGAFALNRATHKLYVSTRGSSKGAKVIDTTTNVVTAGLDFGSYREPTNRFIAHLIAVDDSPAPAGNKVYVLLVPWDRSKPFAVRVFDGESDTNLTDEGSDIVLPVAPARGQRGWEFPSMVVNPTTHKIYLSTNDGQIVVIDGAKRSVIKALNPDAGSFLALDPVANKIFVLGRNGGAIIDGATDTVTPPPQPLVFEPYSATFNEVDNRIYVVGREVDTNGTRSGAVFVLDGSTGGLVASQNGFSFGDAPDAPISIAIVPNESTVYLGSEAKIYVVNAGDLSRRGELPHPGMALTWDRAASGVLYAAVKPGSQSDDAIRVIDRQSGAELGRVTTSYAPSAIKLNTQTDRVYVLDSEVAELVVLDANERAVIARVSLPTSERPDIRRMAVSERLNRVYVTRWNSFYSSSASGSIDVLDGATNQLRSSFPVPYGSGDLVVDDPRRRLYLAFPRASTLTPQGSTTLWALRVYDADTETLITSFDVSGAASGGTGTLAVNPVTGRIYMHTAGDRITVLDSTTLSHVADVAIEKDVRLSELAVNIATNKIYFGGTGKVTVVDGTTNSVENVFKIRHEGSYVGNIVVDEEADVVYVPGGGRIAMFEGGNGNAFLGETTGSGASDVLAFRPGARQLFMGTREATINYTNGSVRVLHATGRARLANLSTRMRVGTGEAALISGFIVTGPAGSTKKVVLRAIGPSLQRAGISDALADPTLELFDAAANSLTNDNWKINDSTLASQQAELERIGLAPTSDAEAALVADLAPGAYTAVLRGKSGATGTGLAEVYDLGSDLGPRLANIATRGHVASGDGVMIGGVIVNGSGPSRVLVRAIGPSLRGQLNGVLEDTVLELRGANGEVLQTNDDWKSDQESEIASTTIPPNDERESAILAGLLPGNYTAIVRGKGNSTGVALVEVYQLQ